MIITNRFWLLLSINTISNHLLEILTYLIKKIMFKLIIIQELSNVVEIILKIIKSISYEYTKSQIINFMIYMNQSLHNQIDNFVWRNKIIAFNTKMLKTFFCIWHKYFLLRFKYASSFLMHHFNKVANNLNSNFSHYEIVTSKYFFKQQIPTMVWFVVVISCNALHKR